MNFKNIIKLSAICFFPILAHAELKEVILKRMNADYNKISQLQKAENKNVLDFEKLKAENNKIFLEKIKKKISKKELEAVAKDLNSIKMANSAQIGKNYLSHIDSTKNLKLSDKNQQLLIGLIKSSEKHLYKGVKFASLTNTINITQNANATSTKEPITKKTVSSSSSNLKTDLQMKKQDENIELKKIQKESLHYSKLKKNQYKSDDDDSLFGKVSKAYVRNLGKVIDDDEKDQ